MSTRTPCRRWAAVVLAALTVVAVSCGGDDQASKDADRPSTTTTEATTDSTPTTFDDPSDVWTTRRPGLPGPGRHHLRPDVHQGRQGRLGVGNRDLHR